jgi:DNA-binding response OmpR family regulator
VEVCRPLAGGRGDGADGDGDGVARGLGKPGTLEPAGAPGERLADGSSRTPETRVRRILVVDDEPSIRLLCRVNLAASGMEVLEAANGHNGIDSARTLDPDLVLLDVMMPGIDGWGVAEQLSADVRTRELPVIFLTAKAERADRERGYELGGVAYLLKPFDPVTLADTIEEVLDRIRRGEREVLRREMLSPQ